MKLFSRVTARDKMYLYSVYILRLTPYHYHFNAIEMIWCDYKRKCNFTVLSSKPLTYADELRSPPWLSTLVHCHSSQIVEPACCQFSFSAQRLAVLILKPRYLICVHCQLIVRIHSEFSNSLEIIINKSQRILSPINQEGNFMHNIMKIIFLDQSSKCTLKLP